MKKLHTAALLLIGAMLAGCSANGLSQNPYVAKAPLASNKATLSVGTAMLPDGKVGLNVVATYRQPDGLSATLLNTPTLAGPSGFKVPTTTLTCSGSVSIPTNCGNGFGGSGTDAGTNSISAIAQSPNPTTTPSPNTFGQVTGLYASGFGPFNDIGGGGTAYYPGHVPSLGSPYNISAPYPTFEYPFYAASKSELQIYLGGPPAFPFFNDGTYPGGFKGYMQGWSAFEATPVAGTYTLNVAVPAINTAPVTATATASLGNLTPLPAVAAPTYVSDGKGGGSGTVSVPADPRVAETLVYIQDTNSLLFYTVGPLTGTGTLSYALPDNLGPCTGTLTGPGCQNTTAAQTPSIVAGHSYKVYAVVYDYPAFESLPPGNLKQIPTLAGANGQSDISLSPATTGKE